VRCRTRIDRVRGLVGASSAYCCLRGGTPVGVKRMDATTVQRQLSRSILSPTRSAPRPGTPSSARPDDALRRRSRGGDRRLREVGRRGDARRNTSSRRRDLVSLRPSTGTIPHTTARPRCTRGCSSSPVTTSSSTRSTGAAAHRGGDLYNRGIARGFGLGPDGDFLPRSGAYPGAFGTLGRLLRRVAARLDGPQAVKFVPVAELDVEGRDPLSLVRHRCAARRQHRSGRSEGGLHRLRPALDQGAGDGGAAHGEPAQQLATGRSSRAYPRGRQARRHNSSRPLATHRRRLRASQ